jgi:predicted ABC-type exoprotein transport system permease subunit
MSYKSIFFFIIIFGIIIFGYFHYDKFLKYFPIHILINVVVVLIGLCTLFFPNIIQKMKNGDENVEPERLRQRRLRAF